MTQQPSRVLITGVAGFVGKHLARYLAAVSPITGIHGIALPGETTDDLQRELGPRLEVHSGNLTDAGRVREILEQVRPNWVFHLAAQAFVPTAFADPTGTLVNNIVGQVNLLQSVLTWEEKPTVVVICSNEEYGMVEPGDLPLKETAPFRPANPYAVSKVAQDMLGYQYYVAYGLPIVRIRPFNHIGPGQSDRFVASSFARQIAEAEMGLRPPVLKVGNLEAERDYSDVRDIVRGYHLAAVHGVPGDVYNLGSERAVSIRHLLDLLLARSRVQMRIEQDPARLRPADIPRVVADCSKFRALTGWRAEIPLEQTLADVLGYWRETLKK
ncbi:MAG: GDP-mannose 4,6-dehydratase [Sphingomonadaceae bacterium]